MQKTMSVYNRPATLERHFENLAQSYSEAQEVYSLWSLLKRRIEEQLLQLWNDLIQNRYSSCGLSRENVLRGFDLFDLLDKEKAAVFGNYDITVEVIEDKLRGQVIVVVKDKGIGINTKDVQYIADIGSSKEKNIRVRRLMRRMPAWLKPSGVFGIGLQSVFQLTDCIEFYTRQHNQPERQISIYSYGRNQGKIETKIVSEYDDDLYFDNAIPGTNVGIKEWLGELKKVLTQGQQLEKCVSYIMNKRRDKKLQKEEIQKEYENFLEHFYRVMAEKWAEPGFRPE